MLEQFQEERSAAEKSLNRVVDQITAAAFHQMYEGQFLLQGNFLTAPHPVTRSGG